MQIYLQFAGIAAKMSLELLHISRIVFNNHWEGFVMCALEKAFRIIYAALRFYHNLSSSIWRICYRAMKSIDYRYIMFITQIMIQGFPRGCNIRDAGGRWGGHLLLELCFLIMDGVNVLRSWRDLKNILGMIHNGYCNWRCSKIFIINVQTCIIHKRNYHSTNKGCHNSYSGKSRYLNLLNVIYKSQYLCDHMFRVFFY